MTEKIRMLLVDDHVVLRVGLRAFFEEQAAPEFEVIGEASDGQEALDMVEQDEPDIVLLDIAMKGMDGLETATEMRRKGVKAAILVLTQYDDPIYLRRIIEVGANGYVLKSSRGEDLLAAIRAVLEGGTYVDPQLAGDIVADTGGGGQGRQADEAYEKLTPRERQILKMIAEGRTNKEVAASLGLAVKTVMNHRFNLMDKLDIHNQAKLVHFAIRAGLIPQPRD